MNIGLLIGKVKAASEKPEVEMKGPSRAELLQRAKEAAANKIIKAIKDEEPAALVYAMADLEELCDAAEMDMEDDASEA